MMRRSRTLTKINRFHSHAVEVKGMQDPAGLVQDSSGPKHQPHREPLNIHKRPLDLAQLFLEVGHDLELIQALCRYTVITQNSGKKHKTTRKKISLHF